MTRPEFAIAPFEFEAEQPTLEAELRHGKPPTRPRPRPRPPSTRFDQRSAPCVCPAHGTEFIRWVQSTLNRVSAARLPVDGIMSAAARSALREFQRRKGLSTDGIAGPDTEQALREARRPAEGARPAQAEGEADEFEALEFESASSPTPATYWQRVTSPALDAMTCQLLCASNLAYAPSPQPTSPYYQTACDNFYYAKAGFVGSPLFIPGKKTIDACLIGTVQGPAGNPAQQNVVLAFRGTAGRTWTAFVADWLNNFEAVLVPFTKIPSVLVHKGFNDSIESFFGRGIVAIVKERLKANPGAKLYITGHSKGGALAYLGALLLRTMHPEIPIGGVISFEAPRAGHPNFVAAYNASGIDSLRYEFQNDIAPHMPPSGVFGKSLDVLIAKSPAVAAALSFLYPQAARPFSYEHAGTLRFINWSGAVVGDSLAVQTERVARLSVLLAASAVGGAAYVAGKLAPWHSISCGSSADAYSGSWRAICKTEVCK